MNEQLSNKMYLFQYCCDGFVGDLRLRRSAAAAAYLCGILQHAQAEPASLHLHLHRGSTGHSGSGSLVSAEHDRCRLKIPTQAVKY